MGYGKGKGKFSGYICVKYIFFIFNVVFWLLGCALLGVGIWLHVSKGAYATIAPSYSWLSLTSICMVVGGVIISLGFVGCCGAIMENQCMLLVYFILVVLIFVLEIAGIVLAFIYHMQIENFLKAELQAGIHNKSEEDGLMKAWDSIQSDLRCCGVSNFSDWYQSARWPSHDYVPKSCCIDGDQLDCERSKDPSKWHREGCYRQVQATLDEHVIVVVVVGLTVGILQILGLVASMALFCFLRTEKYDDYMPSCGSDQY